MVYFLIFAAVLLRILSHYEVLMIPHNFEAIGAMALFGGTYLKDRRLAVVMPLAAMVVSDIFIGFDSLQSRAVVYGSFMLIGLMGLWLRNHKTFGNVVGVTLFGSVLFYIITNLVWFYPVTMYPHTIAGQIASYINALPFFRGTLLGDLFYVGAFFGIYESVKAYQSRRKYVRTYGRTDVE